MTPSKGRVTLLILPARQKLNSISVSPEPQSSARWKVLRQRLVRRFHVLLVMFRHTPQEALVINDHALAAPPPRQNGALFERLLRVGHHQVLVEDELLAQPVADRARASRGIEGEMLGRERLVALARRRAEVAIGMKRLDPIGGLDFRLWTWTLDSASGNWCKTSNTPSPQRRAVSTESLSRTRIFSSMTRRSTTASMVCLALGSSLTRTPLASSTQLAVHAGADEALAGEPLDHVAELALFAADHRRQQHHAGARRQREDSIHDVAGGLARRWARRCPGSRAGRRGRRAGGGNRRSRWWWR